MASILITDTLFVEPGGAEERRLLEAGHALTRIDHTPDERELTDALQGKAGYILGGVEHVTERVIEATDSLQAIAFAGSGYTEFIPAWEFATSRGIEISAAVGANAQAVAEWSVASAAALVRHLPELTAPGGPAFVECRSSPR